MTQEPKHPHNRKKRHPNWGGRRLGADAPKGNMNALKHGRRSARMTKLGIMLAANPKTRDALLAIADKWDQKQMKATEVAADIFEQILERGIKLGEANAARRDASRRSRSARPHFDAILEDPSKVDRSASYAARWVAKNIVAAGLADRVEVELSYAIGHPQPIGVSVETFGTHKFDHGGLTELVREVFDLSPNAIIRDLRLRRPIYRATSAYGHFGRHDIDAPWEETNRVDDLRKASEKLAAAQTA